MIPANVERRARWVLDSIGATEVGFGDDVPFRAEAWDAVGRGERPDGDELAEAFFHLARVEERDGPHDEHGRFRAASSSLDPLDPPLERLRKKFGASTSYDGASFLVALTHDVDTPSASYGPRAHFPTMPSRSRAHVAANSAVPRSFTWST